MPVDRRETDDEEADDPLWPARADDPRGPVRDRGFEAGARRALNRSDFENDSLATEHTEISERRETMT